MRRIITAVTFLGILLPGWVASAGETAYEQAMARGVSASENGDNKAAALEFSSALGERPNDPEALLYLGIAQNRAKETEAESTLKKALSLDPANPRTNLELGILYLNRGVNAEAEDYFENTVRIAPDSAQASNAREHLRLLKSSGRDKRWELRFLTGVQYDSNVLLNAEGVPLPVGVERSGDWRGIFNLGVKYSPLRTNDFDLTASYSLYQSFHFRLDQFDINQNQVELAGKYRFNDMLAVKLGYTFEYQFIGGDSYADNNSVMASLLLTDPASGISTSVDYRYRNTGYKNTPMFSFNHERSGDNHQAGFTSKLQFGNNVLFRAGYYFDQDLTYRDYWDYGGKKGLAGMTMRLPFSLVMDVGGEAYFKDYEALYPGAGAQRKDTSWTGSLVASRFFGEMFSLTAGIYYNRNESNIAAFDYVRTITSLLAQVRF